MGFMPFRRSLTPLAVSAGCLAALLVLPGAASAVPAVYCGATITTSVTLTANLDCSAETPSAGAAVLTVGADRVKIDLNGFSIIDGDDQYETVIRVENRRDITIQNGSVAGGSLAGIHIKNSRSVKVKRVNVSGTATTVGDPDDTAGVYISGGRSAHLDRVQVTGTGDDGIFAENCQKLHIHKSSSSANADDGLDVEKCSDVHVHESTFSGSTGGDGVEVDDATKLHLHRVTASGNNGNGVDIDKAPRAHLERATASNNGDNGLEVKNSTDAHLYRGEFNGNVGDGMSVENSSVKIDRIVVRSNTEDGLHITGSAAFRVKRLSASLNTQDGVRVEGNTGARAIYVIERSASSNNTGDGFDIAPGTVTGKKNVASGNTGSNTLP